MGFFPRGVLGEPGPRTNEGLAAEVIVPHAFIAGNVANYLISVVFEVFLQLGCLFENVVVIATAHASVAGNHQHRGPFRVFPFPQHGVVERTCRRQSFHHIVDLGGVRFGCFHLGLCLGDA